MTQARILIVEDENIVAMDIQGTLQDLGYAIAAVTSSGEESIQKAAETRPDLVLMDIRLKGEVDGIEAANQIRVRFDTPVVYLTAYADEQSLQRAKITEPFGYVLKPFEERELRTVIEIALYKHRMERKLKEREQWLATTLGSIGDAVVTTDERGFVTSMNPAAEALTGWEHEQALNKEMTQVLKVLDEEGHAVVQPGVTEALQKGVVVGLTDHTLIAKDGREIPVSHSIAPIKDEKGKVSGLVFVLRDVTERKQAERERRRLEAEIRQAQKMEALGLLAGCVAHDFKNMLTVILGNVQLGLKRVAPRAPIHAELLEIETACKQAATLVGQLLVFGRRQALKPRVLDLNEVISGLSTMLGHTVGENVDLRIGLAPGLKAVLADADSMVQAVMNLTLNARDAMRDGGVLTIETAVLTLDEDYCHSHPDAKVGEYVRLSVCDTGVGMDEVTQAHLFEPFFTTKEVGKGTGLGLPVVYGIVKQHEGWIEVSSQPGHGTRFDIYLPVWSAPAGEGSPNAASRDPVRRGDNVSGPG